MMTTIQRCIVISTLVACLFLTACRTGSDQGHEKRFSRQHPGYKLTEVPLLSLEREAFWRYQYLAIGEMRIREKVKTMTKEELLKSLDATIALDERAYQSVRAEIAEVAEYVAKGAKIYWYRFVDPDGVGEEGYIVLSPEGQILHRTGL
jgi:hypothetical protein